MTIFGMNQGGPPSCSKLSIGSVLGFLWWEWKLYTRVLFMKSRSVPVPTALRVLGLQMDQWLPAMEVSCECIE
jgi:hypothetical protein